jgi:GMP synthase (glutamine-hydrolysing)
MITILQHGEDEGPGTIAEHLGSRRIPFRVLRLYAGDPVPGTLPENLIVLGGQMSINDTREHPHFRDEKALIRKMILAERPVLGICLGAQMIASASGEEVRKGVREIGWKTIQGCSPAWRGIFPETFPVFHWHEETFNLPPGSTLVVRGDTVKNQAFRLGSAVGVQFHPEVNETIITAWAKTLPAGRRTSLLEESRMHCEENRRRCHTLIDAFAGGWAL